MRIRTYKSLPLLLAPLLIPFFITIILTQTQGPSAKPEEKDQPNGKSLQEERTRLEDWERRLHDRELTLKLWEDQIQKRMEELKKENLKLVAGWEELRKGETARRVDSNILGMLEKMDPAQAVTYLLNYHKTDKEMFFSIIKQFKKSFRQSVVDTLTPQHPEIVMEIFDHYAQLEGRRQTLSTKSAQQGTPPKE